MPLDIVRLPGPDACAYARTHKVRTHNWKLTTERSQGKPHDLELEEGIILDPRGDDKVKDEPSTGGQEERSIKTTGCHSESCDGHRRLPGLNVQPEPKAAAAASAAAEARILRQEAEAKTEMAAAAAEASSGGGGEGSGVQEEEEEEEEAAAEASSGGGGRGSGQEEEEEEAAAAKAFACLRQIDGISTSKRKNRSHATSNDKEEEIARLQQQLAEKMLHLEHLTQSAGVGPASRSQIRGPQHSTPTALNIESAALNAADVPAALNIDSASSLSLLDSPLISGSASDRPSSQMSNQSNSRTLSTNSARRVQFETKEFLGIAGGSLRRRAAIQPHDLIQLREAPFYIPAHRVGKGRSMLLRHHSWSKSSSSLFHVPDDKVGKGRSMSSSILRHHSI
jgi:hypothetical protein